MFVIVCYDVPAKRTQIYRKLLKEFLIHEQASVFMGDLPESELLKMGAEISKVIGPKDRILRMVCRNRHNIEVFRLNKEAGGGQMSQEKDAWHGQNWSII